MRGAGLRFGAFAAVRVSAYSTGSDSAECVSTGSRPACRAAFYSAHAVNALNHSSDPS